MACCGGSPIAQNGLVHDYCQRRSHQFASALVPSTVYEPIHSTNRATVADCPIKITTDRQHMQNTFMLDKNLSEDVRLGGGDGGGGYNVRLGQRFLVASLRSLKAIYFTMLSQLSPSASQVTATCSGIIITLFKRDSLIHILSQINPVRTIIPHFFKNHFNFSKPGGNYTYHRRW
jgi:hypothetical protein